MICRDDPSPFVPYLGQTTELRLYGANGERGTRELIEEFRARPVAFVVATHRLPSFPAAWQEFYKSHYAQYAGTIWLAGQYVTAPMSIDIIVAGRYRWHPDGNAQLTVMGKTLHDGEDVTLALGTYAIAPVGGAGRFTLAVEAPPSPPGDDFHDRGMRLELGGYRRSWWSSSSTTK
jgi:hypothetical protein